MRADQAARDIRRKKAEHIADQAQRVKIGQIEDTTQTAEHQDVLQQEADLTSGHGIVRYTGLISVGAPAEPELQAALVGQQAQAFTVTALPLCRVV
ncbi:MAG: hypothetical protein LBI84_02895 [Propionibacteriaceae bacterium]|jgi:hypothetical protein|nr:hypothetical protein [Propionibacteriaceae bacterium]